MPGARPRPNRLLRFVFEFPAQLYQRRLGWLLGHRFLLLVHIGRKSGQMRRTVLEVIAYNAPRRESVVVSLYGDKADWYRNIQARPAVEIQTGRTRYAPVQYFLQPEENYRAFRRFLRRNPLYARLALWTFARMLGLRYGTSAVALSTITGRMRMVAFRPKAEEL